MKVSTFRDLMREQAEAAVRVSGAHHSSWNNRLAAPIARDRPTGGTANWDNSISYNPRHVDEPLQDMFRNARVHNQDRADLRRYRDALRVVLHENVHLLAAEGRDHSQAQTAFANGPGVRAFEESVTELYAHQRLNDYIDDLGLDQIAPGIKDVRSPQVYKEFTPAAEGFVATVGRRSGVSRDELIERLAVVTADQKFRVAAQVMFENSELPGLVPSDQREQAIGQIARAMGPAFDQVGRLPAGAGEAERRVVGAKAAGAGYRAIGQLKKQWQMPAPEQQVERGAGAEQRQAAQLGRGGASQSADTPVLPPDIAAAAARAGLSGPHLTSAARLEPERQGARGVGVTLPAQRPGAETQR